MSEPSPAELVHRAIVASPLGRLLGIQLERADAEACVLRLPYRSEVTTLGDLVHGGALSALVDVAATAAAWLGVENPANTRGTTVSLSVNFLRGLRGKDAIATARPVRRGRSIQVIEVDVADPDGDSVVRAIVTYKLDGGRSS